MNHPAGALEPTPLLHFTEDENSLADILSRGRVLAENPYGALHNHRQLGPSQRVSCFSAVDITGAAALTDRHGQFGLAFSRSWMQDEGAAPVWYLPRNSQVQSDLFETVKSLAFRRDPDLEHFLWRFTPFIDYPQDSTPQGGPSPYDWRWEQEWRVRGDLRFAATDVAFLIGPQVTHELIREIWLWEVLDADSGLIPPIVDVAWSRTDLFTTLHEGPNWVTTDQEIARPESGEPPWELGESVDGIDTAPQSPDGVDDRATERDEAQQEWTAWLEEMERDDI